MKFDQINWGIIGCGNVTEVKSGPAFQKAEHSSLVAVMRRDKEKAADYAKRHGVPKWYHQADGLINDPEVNAIYIATPPDTHAQYAIQAMRAGKPVYVEKPMALNHAECQQMIEVSKETGMPLFVAYYRRTLPAFLKMKELVESGVIGKPISVSITLVKGASEQDKNTSNDNWRVDPKAAGAGYFFDLASHQLDYLDFLFGPITRVAGTAVNRSGLYRAEDTVVASFAMESGVVGNGLWSFVADESATKDDLEIIGTKGKINLPSFQHTDLKLTTAKGTLSFSFQNPENISYNLVDQVVQSLRGEAECVSTGVSAARTNWVMEQIVQDYYH
ncbi:Gfo/Idh/MocA family oxidoreductase [uncultured Sunxiuqinia sp.]|uniref:Gfo/Idh/MocA family protein n=1 Tax=uncultured Sunxiuqinia sp. TaxID=1573825 RepID=UPI002625C31B|nr:Gfo/Idh/MocA family oxidoreductase [uncultured Sunxiuqinia sp.]